MVQINMIIQKVQTLASWKDGKNKMKVVAFLPMAYGENIFSQIFKILS